MDGGKEVGSPNLDDDDDFEDSTSPLNQRIQQSPIRMCIRKVRASSLSKDSHQKDNHPLSHAAETSKATKGFNATKGVKLLHYMMFHNGNEGCKHFPPMIERYLNPTDEP